MPRWKKDLALGTAVLALFLASLGLAIVLVLWTGLRILDGIP